MAMLPWEQVTQRHPRGIVAAHGVVLWETQTAYDLQTMTGEVINDDVVEPGEVEIAHMPSYEGQGGSPYTENGFGQEAEPTLGLPVTLVIPFQGDLTGRDAAGSVVAVGSGAVRFVDGVNPGTQAVLIEQGGTNYHINPYVVNDLSGHEGSASVSITRDLTRIPAGWPSVGSSVQATRLSGSFVTIQTANADRPVVTEGETWSAGAWVYHELGVNKTIFLVINWYTAGGSFLSTSSIAASIPTHTWTWMEVTGTAPASSGLAQANPFYTGASGSNSIWVTGIQLSKGPATTLIPAVDESGNLETGYAWTGTAHASSSTRSESLIHQTSTTISTAQGSAMVRVRTDQFGNENNNGNILWLGESYSLTEPNIGLYTWTSETVIHLTMDGRASGAFFDHEWQWPNPTVFPNTWVSIYIEWQEGQPVTLIAEGVPPPSNGTDDRSGVFTPEAPTFSGLNIGHRHDNASSHSQFLNDAIGGLAIFDRPLSDDERTVITEMSYWTWDLLTESSR